MSLTSLPLISFTKKLDELHAHPLSLPVVPPAQVHHISRKAPSEWYKEVGGPELERVYSLPDKLLLNIIEKESSGNSLAKNKKSGALGLFQELPRYSKDALNPIKAAQYAAKTLHDLYLHFGNWEDTLASYNWGRGNIVNFGIENSPEETKKYVDFFKKHGINMIRKHSVADVNR